MYNIKTGVRIDHEDTPNYYYEYEKLGVPFITNVTVSTRPFEGALKLSKLRQDSRTSYYGITCKSSKLMFCIKRLTHYFGHVPKALYVKEVAA